MTVTMPGYADKLKTLIVDDDTMIVKLVKATLDRRMSQWLDVIGTADPGFVWGTAATENVDICITDMNMPSMNGFHLLKELKELNPLTQVVFLTGHPTVEAAKSAFRMGADEFLAKPIDLDTLCDSMQFLARRAIRWKEQLIGQTSSSK